MGVTSLNFRALSFGIRKKESMRRTPGIFATSEPANSINTLEGEYLGPCFKGEGGSYKIRSRGENFINRIYISTKSRNFEFYAEFETMYIST